METKDDGSVLGHLFVIGAMGQEQLFTHTGVSHIRLTSAEVIDKLKNLDGRIDFTIFTLAG